MVDTEPIRWPAAESDQRIISNPLAYADAEKCHN